MATTLGRGDLGPGDLGPGDLGPGDLDAADLGPRDVEDLASRGIGAEEARRQLELLRSPPPAADLDRPCTVGDGILHLDEDRAEEWIRRFAEAADLGRVIKLVPASGAATRMFRSLLPSLTEPGKAHRHRLEALAAGGDLGAADVLRLASEIHRFAFAEALERVLAARGSCLAAAAAGEDLGPLLDALLGTGGLALADAPKGMIPFHHYPDGPRTPFAEHLVEALGYARDAEGLCRLHFTVAPAHRRRIEEHVAAAADRLRAGEWGDGARFEVGYSEQSPATDTLALDGEGRPWRGEDGRLLLRPGGHGALLWNLRRLDGDLVLIKNVDNVQPDRYKGTVVRWKRLLGGFLLELEERIHGLLAALHGAPEEAGRSRFGNGGEDPVEQAIELIAENFDATARQLPPERRRAYALERLDRPLRVCGVVPNRGEPGGGPFWVRSVGGGCSPQIVEAAQIAEHQRALLASGTHFNPVDLVCSIRDWRRRPFDLEAFVDPAAAFVTTKNHQGRPLVALEHPGLWNGAMAGWNTVFVEVPAETFSPVKTVFDLLRPEHQPA